MAGVSGDKTKSSIIRMCIWAVTNEFDSCAGGKEDKRVKGSLS